MQSPALFYYDICASSQLALIVLKLALIVYARHFAGLFFFLSG